MSVVLNKHLVEQQKITAKEHLHILSLHKEKTAIFDKAACTDDKYRLRMYAEMVTLIEFELQRVWGFPKDSKFHMFWQIPKCTCPKMDNRDMWPSEYYVTSGSCPIHGGEQ